MEATPNILLLDADEQSAQDIQRFLKVSAYTFSVSIASDIFEGLNYLKNRKPDIVLLDEELVRSKDFAAFKQSAEKQDIPIVLLSSLSNAETRKSAESAGAADFIVKNKINLFHLQKTILNTLKISEAEAKLDDTFNQFVTQQESLFKLLDKTNNGIFIINSENTVLYANEKAYTIISDKAVGERLKNYITYRPIEDEEILKLKLSGTGALSIRASQLQWNGADANLFMFQKLRVSETNSTNVLTDETLSTFVNALHENVILLKANKIVFANQPALKALRLRSSDILGLKPADIIEFKEPLTDNFSIGSFLQEKETEAVLKSVDGIGTKIKVWLKPMNLGQEFYHMLTFAPVIAEQAPTLPGSRSGEDKFTTDSVLHLASHDLREPVRTILNYVQLISENINNKKYDQAGEYANFAKAAADGMEKLLTDLKAYISIGDYTLTPVKVSMKLVVADVLKQLKGKVDASGAEVNVAELPDVIADRELTEKLVYQLVDNAIKFHKKGKKPVIDIGFDKFEGNIMFCIRDNGLGVSKRYQTKIFELFERLNRVDEYPGNGLGLALCKKIIEMHNGKIWVESLPGFGSSFYFTFGAK